MFKNVWKVYRSSETSWGCGNFEIAVFLLQIKIPDESRCSRVQTTQYFATESLF
jgi:hypothetical protein